MTRRFSPSREAGSQVLPPGEYIVLVKDFTRKTSETSHQDYLKMAYEVLAPEDQAGARIVDIVSLSDNALWRLGNMCLASGVKKEFDIDSDKEIQDMLVGRLLKVTTFNEEYEGSDRTKVQSYIALTKEEREEFGDREEVKQKRGDPTRSKAKGKGRGKKDDDQVPF